MQLKEAYLERVQAELEDLAARVAVVKARMVKQKGSLTLEHHWQLVSVRNRFADFRRCVDELEGPARRTSRKPEKLGSWPGETFSTLWRRFCPLP